MGSVREERAFWVHQIHSTLLNSIGAAILQSRVCEQAVRVGAPDCSGEIQRLQGILAELEATARALTAPRTPKRPGRIASEARRLIEAFRASHPGIELNADIPEADLGVPERVVEAACVVLQEALVNISRHAEARRVEVWLTIEEETILLRVRDDGCGFDPPKQAAGGRLAYGTHCGIRLMDEYAAMAGGRLEVGSARGRGTQVTLFIPVGEPASLLKNHS